MISCIIPTYKRFELLKRAINSALAQTYPNIEILVVGDACPEMSALIPAYSEVRFHNLEKNHHDGGATARNWGILHASGDYIAYLDDDNYWLPNHLTSLVEATWSAKSTWAFSSMQAEGKDFGFNKPIQSGIDTSCVLHPRDFAAEYGLWLSREIEFCHDWEYFSRFVKGGESWAATGLPTLVYNIETCGAKDWFQQKLKTLPEIRG